MKSPSVPGLVPLMYSMSFGVMPPARYRPAEREDKGRVDRRG